MNFKILLKGTTLLAPQTEHLGCCCPLLVHSGWAEKISFEGSNLKIGYSIITSLADQV